LKPPLVPAPTLAWQHVAGEAVIVDLEAGRTVGLNEVGSLVWSLMPERDEQGIADEVARRFDVDAAVALDDVREFLAGLAARGWVREPERA
jgi:hypothetical protein